MKKGKATKVSLFKATDYVARYLSQHSTPTDLNKNPKKGKGKGNGTFNNSDEQRGVKRFKRVQEEVVEIDPRVTDNSFEAKVCVL